MKILLLKFAICLRSIVIGFINPRIITLEVWPKLGLISSNQILTINTMELKQNLTHQKKFLSDIKELDKYCINSHTLTKEMKKMQLKFKSLFPPNHPLRITKAIISTNWLKKYINYFT